MGRLTRSHILVIKLGAMGDLLMAIPALRALRKAHPEAEITLMVGRSCLPVVSGNPFLDETWVVNDHVIYHGSFWRKTIEVLKIFCKGRQKRFDLIFSWHRDRRFALLTRLLGGERRIGLSYRSRDPFLTDTILVREVKHHIDHYLDALAPLGIHSPDRDMVFPLDDQTRRWASNRLDNPNKTPIIGLAPGGARNVKESMASRRWPLEHYRDLGEMLIAKGFRLAIFGGREDKYVEDRLMFPSNCLSFVGECSLKQTAALMSHCRAVVTHDSGPMHLAGAVGVPVFSVFGPTDPREKAPLKNATYFWKPEVCQSAPCYKDGVFPECKDVPCMKAVKPRDIFDALMENSEF